MICASFIWEPGTYDDEFHRLNDLIQKVADDSAGYIGVDGWVSKDGKRKCANYFWKDMESLQMFAQHPTHLEAKREYARWYNGYQIIISEVTRTYGDGQLGDLGMNGRKS